MSAARGGSPRGVLMVSYAYPPNGSPGAMRAVKLARYLPEHGWLPLVVTPRDGYARIAGLDDDASPAGARVFRTGEVGWAKRRMAAAVSTVPGAGGSRGGGGLRSAMVRLARSLMIPDRNMSWYPFALATAHRVVRSERPAAVFSTSPCVTGHLVAMRISRVHGIPWVADFRDPWTLSYGYALPAWRQRVDAGLERRIMRHAARVVLVCERHHALFERAYAEAAPRMRMVRNGYDPADFDRLPGPAADGRFVLVYAGRFCSGGRDPEPLLRAIADLKARGTLSPANFAFQVLGVPEAEVTARIAAHGLHDLVEQTGALPYREALARMSQASAVVLLTEPEEDSIPVKFYDYLAVRRPILALTTPGYEVAELVHRTGSGTVLAALDHPAITRWLEDGAAGRLPERGKGEFAELTRQATAGNMAAVLDEVALC